MRKLRKLVWVAIPLLVFKTDIVTAEIQKLSSRQISKVESGAGDTVEQQQYVFECISDAPCEIALIQIWQQNGKEVALEKYLPPESKVPALFKGTDMGRRMRNMGAFNACSRDEACRLFLVEVTKSIRTLPPEELKQVYHARVEIENEALRNSEKQIVRNFQQAVTEKIAAIPGPGEAVPSSNPSAADSGGVIDFARDPYANVTIQLVRLPNGNREIQKRAGGDVKRLATMMGREGKWLIELNDGTQLEAADVQLTGRGFVAGTSSRPVSFTETGGLMKLNWPAGFHTANMQRGNVAQTGYLLLERDSTEKGSLGGLISSIGELGVALGATRREDYVLMDLHSGKTYPLNIPASGKNVMVMSNCAKKNLVVNVCRDSDTRERLYDKYGKNMAHYAWSIYWFRGPTGTYLAALENGFRNVSVTKLETGEKRIAFSRGMGIKDFVATQSEDGHIRLGAQLAFTNKSIDDLESAFSALPLPEAQTLPAHPRETTAEKTANAVSQ